MTSVPKGGEANLAPLRWRMGQRREWTQTERSDPQRSWRRAARRPDGPGRHPALAPDTGTLDVEIGPGGGGEHEPGSVEGRGALFDPGVDFTDVHLFDGLPETRAAIEGIEKRAIDVATVVDVGRSRSDAVGCGP